MIKSPKSIHELGLLHPGDEEGTQLRKEISGASCHPMVVAMFGQSIVEVELEIQLRDCFKRKDDSTWRHLTGEHGPIRSFNQKIIAGRAFGLYDDVVEQWLNKIRLVRNAFAHTKTGIKFDHPFITAEFRKLRLPPNKRSESYKRITTVRGGENPQLTYVALCLVVTWELMKRRGARFKANLGAKLRRKERKASQMETLASLIDPESQTAFLKWILENQNGDPTTQARKPTSTKQAQSKSSRRRKRRT